eukprot:Skav200099  [mRNA]  locus=scaffold694:508902:510128:- [translate_table: standard]
MASAAGPEISARDETERKIQEIKSLVDAELKNFVSADALKSIKKFSLELSTKIEQLQKTNARIAKDEEAAHMLSQSRLPNTCKPCTVPFETTLWDSISPDETLRKFDMVIPEGTSVRECRNILHFAYLERMKKYDLLVVRQQREELRRATKKSTFVDKCLGTRAAQNTLWQELDLDMEDEIDMKGMSVESLTAKATVLYTRTVDRAAAFLKSKREIEEKAQRKKDSILQDLTKRAPVDFLNDAIDKRIAQAQQKPKPRKTQQVLTSVDSANVFVSTTSGVAMSSNDFAPFVADTPARDKGISKSAGRGKGKGKGKNSFFSVPKGGKKGSGKGKGKTFGQNTWSQNTSRQLLWSNAVSQQLRTGKGGKSKQESVFHFGRKGKGKGGKTGNFSSGKGKSKGKGIPKGSRA